MSGRTFKTSLFLSHIKNMTLKNIFQIVSVEFKKSKQTGIRQKQLACGIRLIIRIKTYTEKI